MSIPEYALGIIYWFLNDVDLSIVRLTCKRLCMWYGKGNAKDDEMEFYKIMARTPFTKYMKRTRVKAVDAITTLIYYQIELEEIYDIQLEDYKDLCHLFNPSKTVKCKTSDIETWLCIIFNSDSSYIWNECIARLLDDKSRIHGELTILKKYNTGVNICRHLNELLLVDKKYEIKNIITLDKPFYKYISDTIKQYYDVTDDTKVALLPSDIDRENKMNNSYLSWNYYSIYYPIIDTNNTLFYLVPYELDKFVHHRKLRTLFNVNIFHAEWNADKNTSIRWTSDHKYQSNLMNLIDIYNISDDSRSLFTLTDFLVITLLLDIRPIKLTCYINYENYKDSRVEKLELFHQELTDRCISYCPITLLISKDQYKAAEALIDVEYATYCHKNYDEKNNGKNEPIDPLILLLFGDKKTTTHKQMNASIQHQIQIIASSVFIKEQYIIRLFTKLAEKKSFKFSRWSCIFAVYYMRKTSLIHDILNQFDNKWLRIKNYLYDNIEHLTECNLMEYVMNGSF